MKNLKYRQRLQNDQWHYWGFLPQGFVAPMTSGGIEDSLMHSQQFTGLTDKNGKEIYEGDIVYHSYFREQGVMEWYEKRTGFFLRWTEPFGVDKTVGGHQDMWPIDQDSFEVIGNIYDNPELLKS
jgi:uncharacterized phage protein (TIGR01671 family)